MSIGKVNHPVWKAFDNQKILKGVTGTESEWWDTNGWTDKVITLEMDTETIGSGAWNLDMYLWVSPKGYHELRNETTVDTEDYEVISIVDSHATGIMTRFDSSDVDDLQRPIRSMKVLIDNDQASLYATVNVWVEGWS